MARTKRTSIALEKALLRADGLRAIDASLDLGNGLSLEMFMKKIEKVRAGLSKYNTLLATVDEVQNELEADETELKDAYSHILIGVAAKYGKNSNEYEKAGGVRKDERKPPTRKPKAGGSQQPPA